MKRSTFFVFALLAGSAAGASAQSGVLSWARVNEMSASQRRTAINRIYARHGWVFSDMAVRRQFLKFDWYHPVPGRTLPQVKARFTSAERRTVERLGSARGGSNSDSSGGSEGGYHSPYAGKPDTDEGERFPETRIRLMSRKQVARMSDSQIRYAINEIYARRGYAFTDPAVRRQFSRFGWYGAPTDITMAQVREELDDIESANLDTLSAERDAR